MASDKGSVLKRGAALVASVSLSAMLGSAVSAADVKVEFSDSIMEKMDRINAIELEMEEKFREHRLSTRRAGLTAQDAFEGAGHHGNNWGNEKLIPDISDFSTAALFQAMMQRGIEEAAPDFDGTVILSVDKLSIGKHPLAVLRSFGRTQAKGSVKVLNASGDVVAEHDIWVAMRPTYKGNGYNGEEYAYTESQIADRVGPIAAEYTEKALETLYPDYDARGAVSAGARSFTKIGRR